MHLRPAVFLTFMLAALIACPGCDGPRSEKAARAPMPQPSPATTRTPPPDTPTNQPAAPSAADADRSAADADDGVADPDAQVDTEAQRGEEADAEADADGDRAHTVDAGDEPPNTLPGAEEADLDEQLAQEGISMDDLPWAVQLGLRVERVNRAFPVVDQLVLVPDAATLVDELAGWSPAGRWPVLIEDDVLTPMFVRSFKPKRIVRRTSSGVLPNSRSDRQTLLERTVVSIWGGNPDSMSPRDVFAAQQHVPAGVVMTSTDDPAWPAALILAAGHGQPFGWLDDRFGTVNQLPRAEVGEALIAAVVELLDANMQPYESLGDEIEAITICRNIAGRMYHAQRPTMEAEPTAMTDLLGRSESGERYAFAGWIFGDEMRSTYTAMCSLFLERERFAFINTYPSAGSWGRYAFDEAQALYTQRGFEIVDSLTESQLSESDWLRMLPRGLSADIIMMNSKGNANFFDVGQTGRMHPTDVPLLHEPAALQMIHSWSLRSPASEATVGAQWLERGVYAYVGSVAEPQLSAFLPPTPIAERLTRVVPFLIACRHWEGRQRMQMAWKVNTIGDPLMICRPPTARMDRVEPATDAVDGVNVADDAAALLERLRDAPDASTFAETIRALELLGRDAMVVDVFRLAQQSGSEHAAAAAPAALPAMFRLRDDARFIEAYSLIDQPTERQKTMLWHLMLPRLGSTPEAATLAQLTRSLRDATGPTDLERIASRVRSVLGQAHLKQLVDKQLEKTTSERTQRSLRGLLR